MTSELSERFGLADVQIVESATCYDGFLRIDVLKLKCRLFEGGWSSEFRREVLRREPGVGVLLYDPLLDKVLLVEQFRVGCLDDRVNGPWALELVAGLVEEGETSEAVAIREVAEEAGITISAVMPVCEYYNSPGGSSEKLRVFCAAFDASQAGGIFGLETESENIRTHVVSRAEALDFIASGRINNAMSIIALQWLQLHLAMVRTSFAAETAGKGTG